MRVLSIFISLIALVSCGEEPSLLERCIEANTEEINLLKKLKENRPIEMQLFFDFKEAVESSNGNEELYKDELDAVVLQGEKFTESLTETELSIYSEYYVDKNGGPIAWEEMYESMKSLQAKAIEEANSKALDICNSQGIY
tara:strand:+ start:64 stop:486 length:423 start_codon:yes stop_codon:yes gene_type:complete